MKKLLIATALVSSIAAGSALAADNEVVWTHTIDIPTLDPYAFASSSALAFQNHIYEALVEWDENYKISPVLATSWKQLDEDTMVFNLREGVTFHNGNTFNADDVVASIIRVTHKDSGIRGNASSIISAKKISEYKVELKTKPSSPIVLNELTGVLMMDKEWLEENNAVQPSSMSTGTESYATNNANGTGPFILESRRRDTQMVLTANDSWWNSDKYDHNIDKLVFKPVGSDQTRVAGLMSGEFDLTIDVPLQDIPRLQKQTNIDVMTKPSMRVDLLSFNMADKLNAKNNFSENPLQDVRVRQALTYAVNRQLIVDKIMRGQTEVSQSYVAPSIAGYNESDNINITYNPQKAKELLKEAGYPDGFNIAFDCVSGAYVAAEQWCPAIQRFWGKIGVNADLQMHPRSTYSTIRDQHKTDISVLGWANLPLVDAYSINQQLIHSKDGGVFGSFNIPQYKNEKVDAYIEEAASELDQEKRKKLMSKALAEAQSELPYLPLHFEPVTWVSSKRLAIKQSSDNVVRMWRAKL